MKEIQLTRGQFVIVDNEDYGNLIIHKWFAHKKKLKSGIFYYASRNIIENGKRRTIRMHWDIIGFPPDGYEVDHIDNDTLNNTRNNLRFATSSQNNQNRRITGRGTSKYKGVHWNKSHNKFAAAIKLNKKCYYLGFFAQEDDAAKAYNAKACELYGEFANLNRFY